MEKEIQLEASTEELLAEYEASQEDISQLRDAFPTKEQFELQAENKELFARNQALRNELQQRETRERQLRNVWQFSVAGYLLIGLGCLLYARGYEWTGMSLVIPGFLEIVWWSAPAFTLGGAAREYEVLLVNKIILTVIAFALLYTLWLGLQRPWKDALKRRQSRSVAKRGAAAPGKESERHRFAH